MNYLLKLLPLLVSLASYPAFAENVYEIANCAQFSMLNSLSLLQKPQSIEWKAMPAVKALSFGYTNKVLAIRIPEDCLLKMTDSLKRPIVSIRYPLTEIRVYSLEVGHLQLLKSLGEKFREEEHYPKSGSHQFSLEELPLAGDLVIATKSDTSLQLSIAAF